MRPWRVKSQLTVAEALAAAVPSALVAAGLARAQRDAPPSEPRVDRTWDREARCHRMLTHVAIPGAAVDLLPELAALLFGAAALDAQPWHPQHRGGATRPLVHPAQAPALRHALALSRVTVGLALDRVYRTLTSEVAPDPSSRVIVHRSVDEGPALPDSTVLGHLLGPTADVLHHDGASLHWHHLVVTPGVGLLPWPLDGALLAVARGLGLGQRELAVYRGEARGVAALVRHPEALRALRAATGVDPLPGAG